MHRLFVLVSMAFQTAVGCNVIDPRPTPATAERGSVRAQTSLPDRLLIASPPARPAALAPARALESPSPPTPVVSALPAPDIVVAGQSSPFTLYGVAWQIVAKVLRAPDPQAPEVGYLRRGTQFRAKIRSSRQGCSRGWHEIAGGGFVCDGDGVRIATSPVSFEPAPAPARRYDAMPYGYAMVSREETPLFYRIPTPEEEATALNMLGRGAEVTRAPRAPSPPPEPAQPEPLPSSEADASAALTGSEAAVENDAAVDLPPPASLPPLLSQAEGSESRLAAQTAQGASLPEYVAARLTKGFYLAVDGRVRADQRRLFWRSVRGRFVRAEHLWPTEPPEFQGLHLEEAQSLPVAFVKRTVKGLRYDPGSRRFLATRLVPRMTAFRVRELETIRGSQYLRISGDRLVRPDWVVQVDRADPPRGIGPDEKWIDVDLFNQTLTAYEGDRPVFVTLISSGRAGFETPAGSYRIQSKHVSATMDDTTNPDGAYSIEDVPWTMYFREGLALHAAFWHDRFGEQRSHGCVNLSPADARFLFQWTLPVVPPSWHGAYATREEPGTRIVIHR